MAEPLVGIRVLDLTEGDGAPFCTMQLGDAGADVVKVEPLAGDWARAHGGPFDHGDGPLFMGMNRNKRSIALDLESAGGRAIVQELARRADVVVHSFPKAADAARLGLDYDTLAASNPKLIYCDISTLERSGPEADLPETDLTVQARAGLPRFLGQRGEGAPLRFGSNYVGVTASLYAMQAIVAALFHRKRTGEGQQVETSYLRTIVATQQNYLTSFSEPDGDFRGFYVSHMEPPSRGMATKDRAIEMGLNYARDPNAIENFLDRLGILEDVRKAEPALAARKLTPADQAVLKPYMEQAFALRSATEIIPILDELGMMFAPIHDYGSMYADPGVLEQGVLTEVTHPVRGTLKQVNMPWLMDGTPGSIRLGPPLLGEHTDEVLGKIGYDAARIASLRGAGTIR